MVQQVLRVVIITDIIIIIIIATQIGILMIANAGQLRSVHPAVIDGSGKITLAITGIAAALELASLINTHLPHLF